jgi:uncharacterized protein (DUF58 family)
MRATPDPRSSPVDAETLDAVASLTIEVRRVVEGLQGGDHASLHLGASVEFAEHKKYSPGDDIRDIDWKALARTDRYFVKTYEREVTLRCLMLIDCSPSMGYRGSRARFGKLEYAEVLLGSMAHVLVRQGDAVGLLPFAERPFDYLPPQRRPEHLPILMARLADLSVAESGATGFGAAIQQAAERAGRRALIVVATDLWGADRSTEIAFKSLTARGHDVVLFHVMSPDEVDLPFERAATFTGMEGEGDVDVDPALVREDYRRAVAAVSERWRRAGGEAGIDLVHAVTATPPHIVLADFAARRHRAGSGARR